MNLSLLALAPNWTVPWRVSPSTTSGIFGLSGSVAVEIVVGKYGIQDFVAVIFQVDLPASLRQTECQQKKELSKCCQQFSFPLFRSSPWSPSF